MSEAKLMELGNFAESGEFSEAEKAALRLADAMSNTPAEVPVAVTDAVVSHFGDRGLVALASVVAREQYRARFNRALGIQSDNLSHGQFCPLPVRSGT